MTNEAKILYILSTLNARPSAADENSKIAWLKERFKNTYSKILITEILENEVEWKTKIDRMTSEEKKKELVSLL